MKKRMFYYAIVNAVVLMTEYHKSTSLCKAKQNTKEVSGFPIEISRFTA